MQHFVLITVVSLPIFGTTSKMKKSSALYLYLTEHNPVLLPLDKAVFTHCNVVDECARMTFIRLGQKHVYRHGIWMSSDAKILSTLRKVRVDSLVRSFQILLIYGVKNKPQKWSRLC